MPTDRTVDWARLKRCFAALHREARPFLGRALLIGGAACWFYRVQLRDANDPDFRVPALSPETESQWLSKDIDFTGVMAADVLPLLSRHIVTDKSGRQHVEVEGVRLGFAQVGLTIDPQEALGAAQLASFSHEGQTVEFLVADPVTLCREKQALMQRRNASHDHLHYSLMRDYVAWRLVRDAERFLAAEANLPVAEARNFTGFLSAVKGKLPEILSDPRIKARLEPKLKPDSIASQLIASNFGLRLAPDQRNG